MDAGLLSKYTVLLYTLVFNTLCSHGPTPVNTPDAGQPASRQRLNSDMTLEQNAQRPPSTPDHGGSSDMTAEQNAQRPPSTPDHGGSRQGEAGGRSHNPNPNPTRPSFSKPVYSFEVDEDTDPGTMVGKVEAVHHGRSAARVVYSVLEDDGEGLFLLHPHSGEFLLSRGLDYETQRHYVLTVGARRRRRGNGPVSGVRAYFSVADVNDNPPVFRRLVYAASLAEDTPVGTCFLAFDVTDEDYGLNGETDVAVITGDEDAMFLVNPDGVLCLNAELDRERRSTYDLTVQAKDRALSPASQLTSTAHVSVLVEDVNDNAPYFVSAKSVKIPEDTPLYTAVMLVQAVDIDTGSNGDVSYSLADSAGGVLSINSTSGTLYLQESLDREQIDKLTVTLTATDKGSPRRTASLELTVIVEDVNDHGPEFTRDSYWLTVREDAPRGTSLLQVHAHDRDVGSNGEVRYQLSPSGPFAVDSFGGVVSVMDRLDREKDSSYVFSVTATDRGDRPRSARAVVNVTVLDVNDVIPRFAAATLTLHVLENGGDPSQLVHQILAVDEDLGVNSQLTYFIQGGNEKGFFSLSPNGTFQVVHNLDREMESLHTVDIIAVDSGSPALTGSATVLVIVDDVNDNMPVFTEDVFTTIVPEDASFGTVFAMITAFDRDDGVSGQIRYSLDGFDGPFSVDVTSGELFTTGALDRETAAMFTLTVIGRDTHPTRPLSGSALVTVLVGDVNDHWPQFLHGPYVAYVPVEMDGGSVICAVTAVDGDTGTNAQLLFSLYGPNADQFSIGPHSGAVFASARLRATGDITVNVHVEDGGQHSKFATTTITFRFRNASEFPVVNADHERPSLSEDEAVGTLVTGISAESSRKGPVSFYLVSGNLDEVFQLHPWSGELTIKNPLDYESTKNYVLLAEARDAGSPPFSSYTEIHINISDVNDNVPEFTQAEYRCEVFENAPPTRFCDVLAIDVDSGSYGSVQYSIVDGNTDGVFTIDSENGMLSTTKSLDRETIPEYNLTVESVEKDNTLHRATAIVLVAVLDTNDHAPRFLHIFLAVIPEDTPIGYPVIHIRSTDDDIGPNAVIAYSIIDQNNDSPFSIDRKSGRIIVVQYLDRETRDHYVVKVNANDSAWSVSTDVTIDITDVNDNEPVFSQHLYSVTLAETEANDVFVMQVLANDADAGQNSHILFVIEPPNEEFWVNATTGEIYTRQQMSSQASAQNHSFVVFAHDCGSVPLHGNATVTVTLVPFNYFPPSFLPFPSLLSVPFDVAMGTELAQLSAVDPDFSRSSTAVVYSSGGGNASDFIEIQDYSGRMILNKSLRRSLNTFLTLIVIARDQGFPRLSSQTEINFEITGTNQYAPQFSESHATLSVPEDLPVGSVIGKVEAEDGDDGVNGLLTYSITRESDDVPFSIGQRTGLISLVRGVDFEQQAVYYLHVNAEDGGWQSATGTMNITVNITDLNDNPPVFTASEYVASVPENSATGTRVLQVMATDADAGINAQITYSLIAGDIDKFALNSRYGTITTLDTFDFELEQMFDLTIKASNTGVLNLFSIAHVTIQVSGVNEFIPAFQTNNLNLTVSDSVPIGTRIGNVSAIDSDRGYDGQVFYLLFGQSKRMGFGVDEQTGEIYTTRDLRTQGYNHAGLKILAKNYGVITGLDVDEAFVQINIIDTNDPPEFTSSLYTAEINEDVMVGTSILKVSAVDQDTILEWNRFSYSVENGNTNSSFSIDPISGIVSVSSPLDRERWPVYNLTVAARDQGLPPASGTASIVVTISDINDNAPRVTFTEAHVMENQPHGTIVATLNASDSDLPPNQGPFTYWQIKPSLGSSFSLTSDGVLLASRPLDRERTPAFQIVVAVRDAGTPPLSSTTTFRIRVLDENDNPSLQRTVYVEVKYFGSAFPGGMIGHVRPEDQDESDVFNCSIRSGPFNMFSIPFGTCELWSSPYQGEATYNITVEASDQLHPPVNNSVYVNYKGFTNTSMDNCALFYISSTPVEEFLSHSYLKFVKALDSLFNLQASKTHVFGIKRVEDEILLLAAIKSYNGQYLNGEIASAISAVHRKRLETQSNLTISHITSDPCLFNPCQNGATCNKNIHISQHMEVLESLAVVFVSPQIELFNCSCSTGFTGALCESGLSECDGDACEDEGVCVKSPGEVYCRCKMGVSGPPCSSDEDECVEVKCHNGGSCLYRQEQIRCVCKAGYEGEFCERLVDNCASSPCVQGNCINSLRGYSCHCPFGVSGVRCEEQSWGFEELSYMEFPPLDPRSNFISLELATVQRDALLLYNPGSPPSTDFLALEIRKGRVHFSYDLGSGPVRLETEKQVVDGLYHTVAARRIGSIGSLQVDSCLDLEATGFCFSQNEDIISRRSLDVGASNMTLGGIRSIESILPNPPQIQSHDFVGCIRNVKVNGVPLVPSKVLSTYNVLERCPRVAVSPCDSRPCQNGGACRDLWSHYVCQCTNRYTGINCATVISEEHVLQLDENAYIEYGIRESYRRDYQLKEGSSREESTQGFSEMELKVKTVDDDGVLVFVFGRRRHTVLMIVGGKLRFVSADGRSGQLSEFFVEVPVADGRWHVLHLYTDGLSTVFTVDQQLAMNITNGGLDLTPVNVDRILLGAAPPEDSRLQHSGFSGCVAYFRVSGYVLPISGFSDMVEAWPSPALTRSGCASPGHCVPSSCARVKGASTRPCLPPSCQTGRDCGNPVTVNTSCVCLHNVSAAACDICSPEAENHISCSKPWTDAPLWIIAVVLTVVSVLLFLVLCITLRRQSARGVRQKRQGDSLSEGRERGRDNEAFSRDGDNAPENDVHEPPDVIGAGKQRPDSYSEAIPSSLQTGELERHEMGSIYSAFPSDTSSLGHGCHHHLYNIDWDKMEPRGMGRSQQGRADLSENPSQDGRNRPQLMWHGPQPDLANVVPQNRAHGSGYDGLLKLLDYELEELEEPRPAERPYPKRLPDLTAPPQCLSEEEVRRLDTPPKTIGPDRQQSVRLTHRSNIIPRTSAGVINCSSDGKSSFVYSEFESEREFPLIISTIGRVCERTLAAPRSLRGLDILPVPSAPVQDATQPEEGSGAENTGAVQRWENLLNMNLPFHAYAQVFDDIAGLPIELKHDCDMQSDQDEII